MNPLDKYLEETGELEKISAINVNLMPDPQAELRKTQEKEMEMWHKWDQGGRQPDDLRPLLKSMNPLVQKQVHTYAGRVRYVPQATIEAEFKNHAVKAIKSYDPNRGAKLSTWVNTNLRKGGRFIKTYQNVGRVVEERQGYITPFNNVKEELAEKYGRAPTDLEMVTAMNKKMRETGDVKQWSVAEVQRMNSELRADILSSTFESDPHTWSPSADDEIMAHLPEVLTPDEQRVFQYIQEPGATEAKTGLIAQKENWSPSKVSRLRKSILQKAMDYKTILER